MTAWLREWVLGITGAALIASVALVITPEGRVKKAVKLVCGMAVMIMLIKPFIGFDYTVYAKSLAYRGGDMGAVFENLENENEKLTGVIIEQACSAYILDKGEGLGINDMTASVSARWSEEGYWYPASARVKTDAEKDLRDKLGYIITAELGIPPEELIWSMNDDK